MPDSELLLSDSWGIYIPQMFATRHLTDAVCQRCGIDPADAAILSDPDNELYWEAWDTVLDSYWEETKEGRWTLWQDGDLWLAPPGFQWDDGM